MQQILETASSDLLIVFSIFAMVTVVYFTVLVVFPLHVSCEHENCYDKNNSHM